MREGESDRERKGHRELKRGIHCPSPDVTDTVRSLLCLLDTRLWSPPSLSPVSSPKVRMPMERRFAVPDEATPGMRKTRRLSQTLSFWKPFCQQISGEPRRPKCNRASEVNYKDRFFPNITEYLNRENGVKMSFCLEKEIHRDFTVFHGESSQ